MPTITVTNLISDMETNKTLARSATEDQIAQIRRHAVNDVTREIMAHGIMLSHEQADTLGEATLAWIASRLGLSVAETDRGVECTPIGELA